MHCCTYQNGTSVIGVIIVRERLNEFCCVQIVATLQS